MLSVEDHVIAGIPAAKSAKALRESRAILFSTPLKNVLLFAVVGVALSAGLADACR